MTQAAPSTEARAPTHPLIESNRIEGTRVYDRARAEIGTIDHLVIEKISGQVAYAVINFSWFFGIGARLYAIPWKMLNYDTALGGYQTDIIETELQDAPPLPHDPDRVQEDEVRRQWRTPYYRK